MGHKFTREEADFIKNNIPGRYFQELTDMFNNHFGSDIRFSQIRAYAKNHKLKNGVDCHFSKG
ncbi:MAG: HNH endonuclease signature motif containing protein, partial [Carboxydocellales bacterium]